MPKPRIAYYVCSGRGASRRGRSASVSERGHGGSDYADMSNEKEGGNPSRRKPKVSRGRFVRPGSAGPKARPRGVADGQTVNIPSPAGFRHEIAGSSHGRPIGWASARREARRKAGGRPPAEPCRARLTGKVSRYNLPTVP